MTTPNDFDRVAHLKEINSDIEIICRAIKRLESEIKRPNVPCSLIFEKEKKLRVFSDMLRDLAHRKKEILKQIEEDNNK